MVKHTQIISKTLLVWLGIALLELFVVRDFAWIFEHWEVKRVIVNFGLTALAMLSLLFILSPIIRHSKTGKNLIFALIAVLMLVQMSHYEVYRSFATSSGFHEFSQDPMLLLDLWMEQFNFLKSAIILFSVYGLFNLLATKKIKIVKWRYGLNIVV